MARSALSANRAVAILDWIISNPGDAFSLSELSRASGINIPSAMAVLQSLTAAGYLVRHPARKTYEAGPALFALGLVTGTRNRALALVDGEVEALAAAVGTECLASIVVGEQIVIVAEAGRPGLYSAPIRIGLRFPFVAPVGQPYVAWSPADEIEAWIARAETAARRLDRAAMHADIATIRAHGYAATYLPNASYQPSVVLEKAALQRSGGQRSAEIRESIARFSDGGQLIVPEPAAVYDVSNVSAPVFDDQGRVLMMLVLNGFTQIEGHRLLDNIALLLASCDRLTARGGGRSPASA